MLYIGSHLFGDFESHNFLAFNNIYQVLLRKLLHLISRQQTRILFTLEKLIIQIIFRVLLDYFSVMYFLLFLGVTEHGLFYFLTLLSPLKSRGISGVDNDPINIVLEYILGRHRLVGESIACKEPFKLRILIQQRVLVIHFIFLPVDAVCLLHDVFGDSLHEHFNWLVVGFDGVDWVQPIEHHIRLRSRNPRENKSRAVT